MQYITFVDLQFTDALMSTVVLFDVAFTFLQVWTKGHIGQPLHFFIPRKTLPGLLGASGGIFALTSLFLIFGGRLYAIKGGSRKTFFRWGSVVTMDLQCFFTMLVTEGNLGS